MTVTINGAGPAAFDADGDLGVGTATPAAKLHVYGSGSTYGYIQSVNAGSGAGLFFRNNTGYWLVGAGPASGNANFQIVDSTAGAQRLAIDSNGYVGIGVTPSGAGYSLETANGGLFGGNTVVSAGYFRNSSGGSQQSPSIQPGDDADTGMYWPSTNNLGFSTGGVIRHQIDETGVSYFYANPANGYSIVAQNQTATPNGIRSTYTAAAPNGTSNVFYLASDTVGTKFTVRSNGGIANYSANNVNLSDKREKQDFEPSGDYLEKICKIPVQKFRYVGYAKDDDALTLGVVAQDVEAVCPELVMESDWSNGEEGSKPKMRLSIYQTDLQYALMRAIQELNAKVTSLEEQVLNLGVK